MWGQVYVCVVVGWLTFYCSVFETTIGNHSSLFWCPLVKGNPEHWDLKVGNSILDLPPCLDPTLVRILEFCFIKIFILGYNLRKENTSEVCILVHFYICIYFCFAYTFSYCLVPIGSEISIEFFQRLLHPPGEEADIWSCWKVVVWLESGGFAFHCFTSLALQPQVLGGILEGMLHFLSQWGSAGKRETFEWGRVFPLNHYHRWHQWKLSNADHPHGHLQWVERRPDS